MKKTVLVSLVAAGLMLGAGCQTASPVAEKNSVNGNRQAATPSAPVTNVAYAMEDVAKHATRQDCWTAIDGKVYDVTAAIDQHPGGAEGILKSCGVDGSGIFNGIKGGAGHPPKASESLQRYQVGYLK